MTSKRYSARTLDANALKSFAHPLRLRIYELLDEHGPSTATRLAGLLGQNTGATSYHLRELARHGMIEIVAGMGRGKEKYWRITPGGYSYGDQPADPDAAGALEFLLDDLIRQRSAELARWREVADRAPAEWYQVSGFGRRSLRLTPEETGRMRDEVLEVLERYRAVSDGRARSLGAEIGAEGSAQGSASAGGPLSADDGRGPEVTQAGEPGAAGDSAGSGAMTGGSGGVDFAAGPAGTAGPGEDVAGATGAVGAVGSAAGSDRSGGAVVGHVVVHFDVLPIGAVQEG
ncbi:helix-turn-helix domain-containing protein [Nonomuraea sp. NPDC049421]|uniref:ArsR/SmtB family transcription factor n=1 Tax=Nonomuraea sp. NPDC049421 TaxID=3155275 RepID=UPI0034147AFF